MKDFVLFLNLLLRKTSFVTLFSINFLVNTFSALLYRQFLEQKVLVLSLFYTFTLKRILFLYVKKMFLLPPSSGEDKNWLFSHECECLEKSYLLLSLPM